MRTTFGEFESSIIFVDKIKDDIIKNTKKVLEMQNKIIQDIITNKDKIIKNIFNNQNETKVQLPVHFERLIENVAKQTNLSHLTKCDISPLQFYEKIDKCFDSLSSVPFESISCRLCFMNSWNR